MAVLSQLDANRVRLCVSLEIHFLSVPAHSGVASMRPLCLEGPCVSLLFPLQAEQLHPNDRRRIIRSILVRTELGPLARDEAQYPPRGGRRRISRASAPFRFQGWACVSAQVTNQLGIPHSELMARHRSRSLR